MSGLWLDLRFACRGLLRAPGFSAVAVVTLALGIGATTSIFGFVNALLLRNLPVKAPEQLHWIGVERASGHWDSSMGYRYYELLRDDAGSVMAVAAESGGSAAITVGGESEQIGVGFVSGGYFSILGARPAKGRLLEPSDDIASAQPVVVLSHRFWTSRFSADPAIVGATLALAGQSYTVAGVAAKGFYGTSIEYAPDLWVPITRINQVRGDSFNYFDISSTWLQLLGRLSPGVTVQQAAAMATIVYGRYGEEYLAANPGLPDNYRQALENAKLRFEPVRAVSPNAVRSYRRILGMLAVAVTFLLLIACGNVGNLLLARCVRRRQEFAVRKATGASRWRLIRQLAVEGVLLSLLGGSVGILIAWNIGNVLVSRLNHGPIDVEPDLAVLAFTLSVSLGTVLLFASYPAWSSSRFDLSEALKGTAIVGNRHRGLGSRGWFVAVQVALCLPLLIGAGLLVRSVQNLYSQDVGFERRQRIQASIDAGAIGYDESRATALFQTLLSNLAAQPSVESVAFSSYGTLMRSGSNRPFYADEKSAKRIPVAMSEVSEGYFETLGIPLLAGRDFDAGDDSVAPKALIINEALALEMFGEENAVGRRLRLDENGPPALQVVGVAASSKYNDLRDEVKPVAYFPFRQRAMRRTNVYLRTEMGVDAAAAMLREQVRVAEPYLPVTGVKTLDQQIEASMRQERMVSTLLTAFGGLALLLTAVGLYGVMAFDVSGRTRELGLRLALGARRKDVLSLVFRRSAAWVLGGAGVGLGLAAALSRYLDNSLFGLSSLDPATFSLSAFVLLSCVALANYLPARRAASVDPMTALRHE